MNNNTKIKEENLPYEYIRKIFRYDPETGHIYWLVSRGRKGVGSIAGSKTASGYFQIGIDGYDVKSHRVAYCLYYGRWPDCEIDHVNRVRSDNRIENLRDSNRCGNARNLSKPSHNTSGIKGVGFCKQTGRWTAWIWVNNKKIWLGRHATKEIAQKHYLAASEKYHKEFGCAG